MGPTPEEGTHLAWEHEDNDECQEGEQHEVCCAKADDGKGRCAAAAAAAAAARSVAVAQRAGCGVQTGHAAPDLLAADRGGAFEWGNLQQMLLLAVSGAPQLCSYTRLCVGR